MIGTLLLLLALGWLCRDYFRDWLEARRERERLAERVRLRQEYLERAPDSAAAHEMLGDVLREHGDLSEAIAVYEQALEMMKGGAADGAGWSAGGGVENKIRLTRLELDQEQAPERFGLTLATREQTCRTCGTLAGPQDRNCSTCGAPLLVDHLLDTLRREDLRRPIVRESLHAFGMFAVVTVALLFASWMPIEVRCALAISALIVIPMRLLKKIGEG